MIYLYSFLYMVCVFMFILFIIVFYLLVVYLLMQFTYFRPPVYVRGCNDELWAYKCV
jgi:hypothetical protein